VQARKRKVLLAFEASVGKKKSFSPLSECRREREKVLLAVERVQARKRKSPPRL